MPRETWVQRFASRSGDRRSSVWRCFTNPGHSDVYLGTRETLSAIKLSLHESGEWHVAFDANYHARKREAGFFGDKPDRWIHQWSRPKPLPGGVTIAFRVIMPSISVIAAVRPEEEAKDVRWLEAPDPPLGNHVAIGLVAAGAPDPNIGAGQIVGRTHLPSGDQLLLVSEPGAIPVVTLPRRPDMRRLADPMPNLHALSAANSLRSIMPGYSEDGVPCFLDLAVRVATADAR
jgi:hypothetical protein